MSELIGVIGLAGLCFFVYLVSYYIYGFVYFLLPSDTTREFKKIKKEFKSKDARVRFREYGAACHTRCDISYSNGTLTTYLDPVSSPFGVYKYEWTKCRVNGIGKLNMIRLSEKCHSYFHNKIGLDNK